MKYCCIVCGKEIPKKVAEEMIKYSNLYCSLYCQEVDNGIPMPWEGWNSVNIEDLEEPIYEEEEEI